MKDVYSPIKYRPNLQMEILEKMYPGIDCKDKYILWIVPTFYCPILSESIECTVNLISTQGETVKETPKTRLRKPFPNKNYDALSMTNGRRISQLGIPFVFDSFEELSLVDKIKITWDCKHRIYESEDVFDTYNNVMSAEYVVDFIKDGTDANRLYFVCTKDVIVHFLDDMENSPLFEDYLSQFESVVLIQNENKRAEEECLTGSTIVGQKKLSQTELFNLYVDHFFLGSHSDKYEKQILYAATDTLTLSPAEYSFQTSNKSTSKTVN